MIALLIILMLLVPRPSMGDPVGKIIDLCTHDPVKGAMVVFKDRIVHTDEQGLFTFRVTDTKLIVRAHGYQKREEPVRPSAVAQVTTPSTPYLVGVVPFTPRALYLSFYGIGDRGIRESAFKLMQETDLNALVIDIKGDRGMIPYRSTVPLASEVGAQRILTVKDIRALMQSLREKGIYTIARIVVFKDNPLALARPDWAIKNTKGEIWLDREKLAWVEPFRKEAWDYTIDIAIEAARYGFDEIQFDYLRFPDEGGPAFSMPSTVETRVNAITGFLIEANRRLAPYHVFVSADIFGYACWNFNDTKIGQRLEDLAPHVDYLSPMLYPSGFQHGIPGYRIPVANPYEIVHHSLERAQERTHLAPVRFRPWLQAFRDYAFDRRHFGDKEIGEQVKAAREFGSHGWMLWNPGNVYSSTGLKREDPQTEEHLALLRSRKP
jgi:hypothetical protein